MKKNFSLILALIVISLKGFAGFNATIYGRATQCPDATNLQLCLMSIHQVKTLMPPQD